MHTIGVEVSFSPDRVHVWAVCPHSFDAESEELPPCAVMVPSALPSEPLPRPYKHDGAWRIPCEQCHGSMFVMSGGRGYPRKIRCVQCGGSGHGVNVTSTYPWFRWNALPKLKASGECVVEVDPHAYVKWVGRLTTKRLTCGKIINMNEFDYRPDDIETPVRPAPEEYEAANSDPGPIDEEEWKSLKATEV